MAGQTDFEFVMAGLVPAIYVLLALEKKGVDARVKPGQDDGRINYTSSTRRC
jgi:hypothetical protein